MAIYIDIDWKQTLVTDRERKKLQRRKVKPLKKKVKLNSFRVWSLIYFIADSNDDFRMYEWKIIEELCNNRFKVKVLACREKGGAFRILIVEKTELRHDRSK